MPDAARPESSGAAAAANGAPKREMNGDDVPHAAQRPRISEPVSEETLADIRKQLVEQLVTMGTFKDAAECAAAITSSSTLLQLGVSSAQGSSLRGWVYRRLEAEISTVDLLKTAVPDLLRLIACAQQQSVGVAMPPLPQPSG